MNFDHINIARKAITDIHGTEKPECNVAGDIQCPVCTTGKLHYRISNYNGHIHAQCDTKGCVRWME
jgi:hypothetical protein